MIRRHVPAIPIFITKNGIGATMETQTRARHRLGGKHSDPITAPTKKHRKPSGRRAAGQPVAVPAQPDHAPTVHLAPVVEVVVDQPAVSFDPKTMPAPVDSVKSQTERITIVRHKKPLTA